MSDTPCDNCDKLIESTDANTCGLCDPCVTLSKYTPPIRVTPIGTQDLELVLSWRSNPKIYDHFRRQNSPLSWNDHLSWYESRSADRHDFIIQYENRRVGVVSITVSNHTSIYLGDFSARGQGIATAAIRWLCERFGHRSPLIAEIHNDNTPSKRLFRGCGFQLDGRDDDWLKYSYEP